MSEKNRHGSPYQPGGSRGVLIRERRRERKGERCEETTAAFLWPLPRPKPFEGLAAARRGP
jgi:hypothetical protein